MFFLRSLFQPFQLLHVSLRSRSWELRCSRCVTIFSLFNDITTVLVIFLSSFDSSPFVGLALYCVIKFKMKIVSKRWKNNKLRIVMSQIFHARWRLSKKREKQEKLVMRDDILLQGNSFNRQTTSSSLAAGKTFTTQLFHFAVTADNARASDLRSDILAWMWFSLNFIQILKFSGISRRCLMSFDDEVIAWKFNVIDAAGKGKKKRRDENQNFSEDPSRQRVEEIQSALWEYGVDRSPLKVAWNFTTKFRRWKFDEKFNWQQSWINFSINAGF